MKPIVLASSSIYRKKQLQQLDIPFTVMVPNIDETPLANESPQQTALRLSIQKAQAVQTELPHSLVIACDQVASFEGVAMGKPLTHENAVKQLSLMQGKRIIFHSGLCLYDTHTQQYQAQVIDTAVTFRPLSPESIEHYLRKEQPYDCAGSAKSEGLGVALIAAIQGDDPNALIGLPLIALVSMLANQGIHVV